MGTEIVALTSSPDQKKEMLLSMTLLLPLTTPHKSPLSDTGLSLKHPIQSHPRN